MILPIVLFTIWVGISLALAGLIVLVSYILTPKQIYSEKVSPYECGFEPFGDARYQFDVHFYIVAILFIVFDIEIILLFPWAMAIQNIGDFGFWSMIGFLILLIIGFLFEWRLGILDWRTESSAH
jgi:NADH-quinone oxidoreductase subunit A